MLARQLCLVLQGVEKLPAPLRCRATCRLPHAACRLLLLLRLELPRPTAIGIE